jgi:formylglycine-generating enzyme required for sulfatase activity
MERDRGATMIHERIAVVLALAAIVILPSGCGNDDPNKPESATPTACFAVTPSVGSDQTDFLVDGSCSSDGQDLLAALQVRWDWDNDGTWDTEYSTGKTASHRFSATGTKTIKLEVKDTAGLTNTTTRQVTVSTNSAPSATFTVTPESGTTWTIFTCDASGCTDGEDSVDALMVRWDWEDDGNWDTDYSTKKTADWQYGNSGARTIRVEVIDTGGATGTATRQVVVSPFNAAPTASFIVSPRDGILGMDFRCDASASTDNEEPSSGLEVRWDWEDDGTWDTEFSEAKVASHQYASVGVRRIRLEVKDSGGLLDTSTMRVRVFEPPPAGFVLLESGTFMMGDESGSDARRQVTLTSAFYLCDHEIRQEEWSSVMGWNDSAFLGDARPVEKITWLDAVNYCNERSMREGLAPPYNITNRIYDGSHLSLATVSWNPGANGYRLPTEAEWEYACRGGSTTELCNGDLVYEGCAPIDRNLDQVGWYCGNAGGQTQDVMQKAPNAWQLHDMHGNVSEWCWDWYGRYGQSVTDPTGPATGMNRIVRGGDWSSSGSACRSGYRDKLSPELGWNRVGLRLARNADLTP